MVLKLPQTADRATEQQFDPGEDESSPVSVAHAGIGG
jgi:hypothetical protein